MRCLNEKFLCFAHLPCPTKKKAVGGLGGQKILVSFKSGLVRVMESCLAAIAEDEAPIDTLPKYCVYHIHKTGLGTPAAVTLWVPRRYRVHLVYSVTGP